MTQTQRRFFSDLDKTPHTGKIAGRRFPPQVNDELENFAQSTGPYYTICRDTAAILYSYDFTVRQDGIGWTIQSK